MKTITLQNRNPIALLFASLIFGVITCPILYFLIGALANFGMMFTIVVIPLMAITATVLISFLSMETKAERFLKSKLHRFFLAVCVLLLIMMALLHMLILALIAAFTLFTMYEYRFYLTVMIGLSSTISFFILLCLPQSRLEVLIGSKVHKTHRDNKVYRLTFTIVLCLLLFLVGIIVIQYVTAPPHKFI